MTSNQGWDQAEYHCGRCGHTFTAQAEADYIDRKSAHDALHAFVDALKLPQHTEFSGVLRPRVRDMSLSLRSRESGASA